MIDYRATKQDTALNIEDFARQQLQAGRVTDGGMIRVDVTDMYDRPGVRSTAIYLWPDRIDDDESFVLTFAGSFWNQGRLIEQYRIALDPWGVVTAKVARALVELED